MKTVRVDDGMTQALVRNTALWESFPFLKAAHNRITGLKPPETRCPVCRKKAMAKETSQILESVRSQICALTPDKRKMIKDALNADVLKITVLGPGAPRSYTF